MEILLYFLIIIVIYALFSKHLKSTALTSPIVFTAMGLFLGSKMMGIVETEIDLEVFLLVSELALVLTLFQDASRIHIRSLKEESALPIRLLAIGMPLTIFLGTFFSAIIFIDLSIWESAIVATILAPTDAGLGKKIVNNKLVPSNVRHSLNVESGLNDGLAVPLLILFIALAEAGTKVQSPNIWVNFAAQQLGFGALAGLFIGIIGSRLLKWSLDKDWISDTYERLIFPALAIIAWISAEAMGGNGFIAAFVAGLAMAGVVKRVGGDFVRFMEAEGQLIILLVFFLFGVFSSRNILKLDFPIVLYAILSLTVIRMLPVFIALLGKKLRLQSTLFIGWFGPRGLASIVLGLTLLSETSTLPGLDKIALIIMTTVLMSIFAHGVSSKSLTDRYCSIVATLPGDAVENLSVDEMPVRKHHP